MNTILSVLLLLAIPICAAAETEDSLTTRKRRPFVKRLTEPVVRLFSGVDTAYIEPNHYNFQAMFQSKYTYETYKLKGDDGQSVSFKPKASLKVGPYVGWSLIFVGVTVDVFHLSDRNKRNEWDLSIYTLPFGIDLYYRKSGDAYTIASLGLGDDINTTAINGTTFKGFDSSIRGFDFYYIFNHKRFSYPAAFNQSTQQKRSYGSALAGIGYTRHTLKIDWNELSEIADAKLGVDLSEAFNSTILFEKVTYTDFSISGGYGYNWVFARDWLFASSLSVALSYKKSISDSQRGLDAFGTTISNLRDFKFSDITLDSTGRFGVVYNNGKWFAGASAIVHTYNYSKSNFSTNNWFGSINGYVGLNFGKKKEYRRKNL